MLDLYGLQDFLTMQNKVVWGGRLFGFFYLLVLFRNICKSKPINVWEVFYCDGCSMRVFSFGSRKRIKTSGIYD